jgi:type IV pilus assembly protein PilQ
LVGAASGLNVVTNPDVKAKVTIAVKDLPWDQLLDIVLQQNSLKAKAVGNVIRIYTLDQFAAEERQKRALLMAQQANEPIIMAILPLSYAKADEIKKLIEEMLAQTSGGGTGAGRGRGGAAGAGAAAGGSSEVEIATANLLADTELMQAFVRGKIEVDNRSNSLVITNTEAVIDRIKKVIKELDAPTPQVLIEAKMVSASDSFSRNIGVSWQGRVNGNAGRSGAGLLFNDSGVNITPAAGAARFAITGTTAGSDDGASLGAGFQIGAGRRAGLQAALNIGELNNQAKILSSPRIVVNNKQKASISDGTKIALLAPAPNGTFSVTYQDATLGMDVTPQITNAGSVLLDLSVKNDAPATNGQDISSKTIQTQVLVESGATLVLGGVYTMNLTKKESGVPVLMDIPFLGNLFKAQGQSQSKSELLIFVTPRILDTGATGIGQL